MQSILFGEMIENYETSNTVSDINNMKRNILFCSYPYWNEIK